MRHRGHAHRGARVARVGLEGGIDLGKTWSQQLMRENKIESINSGRISTVGKKIVRAGQLLIVAGQKGRAHTARVRMVLMASSSIFPYGMMGR